MRRDRNRPDTRALRRIGLDAALTHQQLEQLALHTDLVQVRSGQVLCHAGTTPRQFVALIDGTVNVVDRLGRTEIRGAGTRIGGAEIITGRDHEHTVAARTVCTVVVIYGPALRWLSHAPRPSGRHAPPTTILDWVNGSGTGDEDIPSIRALRAARRPEQTGSDDVTVPADRHERWLASANRATQASHPSAAASTPTRSPSP